jgi:hypothetical protein
MSLTKRVVFVRHPKQCLFCYSRKSIARIRCVGFDEVACSAHVRDLEQHAEVKIPKGVLATKVYGGLHSRGGS